MYNWLEGFTKQAEAYGITEEGMSEFLRQAAIMTGTATPEKRAFLDATSLMDFLRNGPLKTIGNRVDLGLNVHDDVNRRKQDAANKFMSRYTQGGQQQFTPGKFYTPARGNPFQSTAY